MTYDPNEPRDPKGMWTSGGESGKNFMRGGHPLVSVEDAKNGDAGKMVAERAAVVADHIGFPVSRMTVTDKDHPFEVNGQKMFAAGLYHHGTDSIELMSHRLSFTQDGKLYPNDVAGVTAHEVEHARFQALLNDYRAEREAMDKDPDHMNDTKLVMYDPNNPIHAAQKAAGDVVFTNGQIREKGFMNPNGTLNEPYASRYPLYTKYTKVFNDAKGMDDFAKTDGVSEYSRHYWTDWQNGKTSSDNALHETIAEIGRLQYSMNRKQDAAKEAHEANVAEIKSRGGTWSPADEKEWRTNSKLTAGYSRYKLGEVDGKKVYFATGKGADKLSPAWSSLYKLTDWNWKRRTKK